MPLDSRSFAMAAKCLATAAMAVCFSQTAWSQQGKVDLNIVAHEDDDLIFMNPDILNSVIAGHREVTVYLTAGNLFTDDQDYATHRQNGAMAGYGKLLQLATEIPQGQFANPFTDQTPRDSRVPESCDPYSAKLQEVPSANWQQSTLPGPGTKTVQVFTAGGSSQNPTITLVFVNLDSGSTVFGYPVWHTESGGSAGDFPTNSDGSVAPPTYANLSMLYQGAVPAGQGGIQTPDGLTYTKAEVQELLLGLFNKYQPTVVRTLDSANPYPVDYTNECNPGIAVGAPNDPFPKGEDVSKCTCNASDPNLDTPNYCGSKQQALMSKFLAGAAPGFAPPLGAPRWLATPPSDPQGAYLFPYDHSDHYWSARFAHDALRQYLQGPPSAKPAYFLYTAYSVEGYEKPAARLSIQNACYKRSILYFYGLNDDFLPPPGSFLDAGYVNLGYQERRCGSTGLLPCPYSP